jgi:murein DD-endopeptidase MepM/ murein hydrolase activator NlpD
MIRSVAEGLVIYSEWSDQSGFVIALLHPGGLVSIYKHNRVVFKTPGSYVYSGEAIAAIGNTGRNSSGTHLHFELWYAGSPVNPLDYFALN